MNRRSLLLISLSVMMALVLTACGEAAPSPTTATVMPTSAASANSSVALQPQTVEGGSVTVVVTPLALKKGEPLAFEIAMDTHSVDLAGDMVKMVVLRDETGKEYTPIAWDGAGSGGHHREGKIKFAALTSSPKSVTLVVKNLAGVPERIFNWDVPQ